MEVEADVAGTLAGIGALVLPFARTYLGPSAAAIERSQRDPAAAERQLLLFAMHKLVVEAGTLPAPGTAYEPHEATFVVDEEGRAPALDLRYFLAALRALSAWATAKPPMPAPTAAPKADVLAEPLIYAPESTRALRSRARAEAYIAPETTAMAGTRMPAPVRTGGCGCRGSAASSAAPPARRARTRRPSSRGCADPKPQCDCHGSCGGRGCGCAGTQPCTDCLPRGSSPPDHCSCGSCPRPEDCTPWTPSCETRNRLRASLKDALCDLLECIESYACPRAPEPRDPTGRVPATGVSTGTATTAVAPASSRAELDRCLTRLLCKLLRSVREALCPPAKQPCAPPPPRSTECLPCSYAVEDAR